MRTDCLDVIFYEMKNAFNRLTLKKYACVCICVCVKMNDLFKILIKQTKIENSTYKKSLSLILKKMENTKKIL